MVEYDECQLCVVMVIVLSV